MPPPSRFTRPHEQRVKTDGGIVQEDDAVHGRNIDPPLLFDVQSDPGENVNAAAKHPEVLAEIAAAVARHRATVHPAPTQLEATSTVPAK